MPKHGQNALYWQLFGRFFYGNLVTLISTNVNALMCQKEEEKEIDFFPRTNPSVNYYIFH
jgi:hypothetical protein